MVKVSVPSSTVPAGLVTVALSVTSCAPVLKVDRGAGGGRGRGRRADGQRLAVIGRAEEVGRAVVDGLDDVRAGRGARGQGIAGAGGAARRR